jgi:DNA-binding CsgD family transcriptional regulator
MITSIHISIISSSPVFAKALQQSWQLTHPSYRCRLIAESDVPHLSAADAGSVLLLIPEDWRELQELILDLPEPLFSLPRLLFCDVRLAGIFVKRLPQRRATIVATNAPIDDLHARLRELAEGRELSPLQALNAYFNLGAAALPDGLPSFNLTTCELEVGCALSLGLVEEELVAALRMKYPTVKSHIHKLLVKMALQTREQIALYFHRALNPAASLRLAAPRPPRRPRGA